MCTRMHIFFLFFSYAVGLPSHSVFFDIFHIVGNGATRPTMAHIAVMARVST